MKEFIKVMKALSDPNRVKLLKILQKRTRCVCEIQVALGIAQPTVDLSTAPGMAYGLVMGQQKTGGEKSHEQKRPHETLCGSRIIQWCAQRVGKP